MRPIDEKILLVSSITQGLPRWMGNEREMFEDLLFELVNESGMMKDAIAAYQRRQERMADYCKKMAEADAQEARENTDKELAALAKKRNLAEFNWPR